jgi:hypothetical protein
MIIAESVANNPLGEALARPLVALLTPAMLIVETVLDLGHGNALVNLAIVAVSFVLYAAVIWLVLSVGARGKGSTAGPQERNT